MTTATSARIRALTIITIAAIAVLFLLSSAVQATGVLPDTESYLVKPGDTLWGIANEYGPQDADTRRIVASIREMNELESGTIMAGQLLEIPIDSE